MATRTIDTADTPADGMPEWLVHLADAVCDHLTGGDRRRWRERLAAAVPAGGALPQHGREICAALLRLTLRHRQNWPAPHGARIAAAVERAIALHEQATADQVAMAQVAEQARSSDREAWDAWHQRTDPTAAMWSASYAAIGACYSGYGVADVAAVAELVAESMACCVGGMTTDDPDDDPAVWLAWAEIAEIIISILRGERTYHAQ